jgi:hypothetical protein
MAEDILTKEYFTLVDIVKEFDKNLITVKGWGVTLSLAALGFGFQYQHYGLFLVASVSGLAFWTIEGVMKQHQMRYYLRMREIEVLSAERTSEGEKAKQLPRLPFPFSAKPSKQAPIAAPQIDWFWEIAPNYFKEKETGIPPLPQRYGKIPSYGVTWVLPHVLLPHIISIVLGCVLFVLGLSHVLGMPL